MSKRKTRERQLARLAARRAAERKRRKRNRIVAGILAVLLVAGVGTGLFVVLSSRNGTGDQAQGTPSAQPSVKVTHGTGKQTGTVKPKPAAKAVACGAQAPKAAGKPKPQFDGPPPLTIDTSATYEAVMKTSCGTISIELLPKEAPETVNSFVFLAEHHFFDGQYLHRIDTSIDVLQGGDPMGTGTGGPGYSIPDEGSSTPSYTPGTLAMANSGKPNTGGSQFFLIVGPKGQNLDSCTQGPTCYTIFGHVTKGLDVGQKIEKIPVVDPSSITTQTPKQTIYIVSVKIKTKR